MLKTHIGACNNNYDSKVQEYSAQFSIDAVSLGATNCLICREMLFCGPSEIAAEAVS